MSLSKGFLLGVLVIGLISATVGFGTMAYFSDAETAEDNTFIAGTIDIAVDGENPWTSSYQLDDLKPSEEYQKEANFRVDNVGTNELRLCKVVDITNYSTAMHPESSWDEDPEGVMNKISPAIEYWLTVEIYDEDDQLIEERLVVPGLMLFGVDGEENYLGVVPAGGYALVNQTYHMMSETTNWAQGKSMEFDITFIAQQINTPDKCGDCSNIERLYLVHSGTSADPVDGSQLYEVALDTEDNKAYFNLLEHVTTPGFNQVDSLGCTTDGQTLYLWDKDDEKLGKYDIFADEFTDLGGIPDVSNNNLAIVLAAVSPIDGNLWLASQNTDEVFVVDADQQELVENLGTITWDDVTLNLQGADIVFDALGNLYVYTNAEQGKVFQLDLDNGELVVEEVFEIENFAPTQVSGMAIRDAGNGHLVVSGHMEPIYILNLEDSEFNALDTYFGANPYSAEFIVGFGDMTVGNVCLTPEE
ncbi:TasA family protein [Methanonatronarchaeum sp. AMET-Sl]|uniref:TasA family protein n=1 Tax=Methanonatronarchaeum sp. AMET-Sl TaxID=3037654 RepID=UPI00244E5267|nr:TasA family protein [Methanonatronarchaeum sp. AMET-Sl]WGI17119.1 TasA family protein [Methanonatronarchaeum sp. AMET-Sl]